MKRSSAKKKSFKKRTPILVFIFIAALLITLPLAIVINQTKQNYRSEAAGTNPLAGMNLNFPYQAADYYLIADQWESTRSSDAALMRRVGDQQKAVWYGEDWAPVNNIGNYVNGVLTNAATMNAVPVFVVYSIPKRDCAGYSGGGSTSIANYQAWVQAYANAINHRQAIVILEPDALANITCLSTEEQTERYGALQFALTAFKAQGAIVYIDAGNARWIPATTMAQRLVQAGIANADGFALNVSNFFTNDETTLYGNQISTQVDGKHFVIDTSRNGLGPYIYPATGDAQWCNPPGRALGIPATTMTSVETVDAFLWIKTPGESDGTCTEYGQNDPTPGTMMPEYALGLAQRAIWSDATPTPSAMQPTLTEIPSVPPVPTNTPTPVPPTPTFTVTPTLASVQLLQNGSFESGLTNWGFHALRPAAGKAIATKTAKVDGLYSAQVTVTKASATTWYVQLRQANLPLTAGRTYTVSFWAKASKNLPIDVDVQQSGGNWTVYDAKKYSLGKQWKNYTYSFTAPASAVSQIAFNLAKTTGTIWIDNVTVTAN